MINANSFGGVNPCLTNILFLRDLPQGIFSSVHLLYQPNTTGGSMLTGLPSNWVSSNLVLLTQQKFTGNLSVDTFGGVGVSCGPCFGGRINNPRGGLPESLKIYFPGYEVESPMDMPQLPQDPGLNRSPLAEHLSPESISDAFQPYDSDASDDEDAYWDVDEAEARIIRVWVFYLNELYRLGLYTAGDIELVPDAVWRAYLNRVVDGKRVGSGDYGDFPRVPTKGYSLVMSGKLKFSRKLDIPLALKSLNVLFSLRQGQPASISIDGGIKFAYTLVAAFDESTTIPAFMFAHRGGQTNATLTPRPHGPDAVFEKSSQTPNNPTHRTRASLNAARGLGGEFSYEEFGLVAPTPTGNLTKVDQRRGELSDSTISELYFPHVAQYYDNDLYPRRDVLPHDVAYTFHQMFSESIYEGDFTYEQCIINIDKSLRGVFTPNALTRASDYNPKAFRQPSAGVSKISTPKLPLVAEFRYEYSVEIWINFEGIYINDKVSHWFLFNLTLFALSFGGKLSGRCKFNDVREG